MIFYSPTSKLKGFTLIESLLSIIALSMVVSVGVSAASSSRQNSEKVLRDGWLKSLAQAEERLSVKGSPTPLHWPTSATLRRYEELGILNQSNSKLPQGIVFRSGRWEEIPPHLRRGFLPTQGLEENPSFDEDPEILWENFRRATAIGAVELWIESARGAALESMFVYLENEQEKTAFAHQLAGPPAARMYEAAWGPALATQIAGSFRDPVLAKLTHGYISEPRQASFVEKLHTSARW